MSKPARSSAARPSAAASSPMDDFDRLEAEAMGKKPAAAKPGAARPAPAASSSATARKPPSAVADAEMAALLKEKQRIEQKKMAAAAATSQTTTQSQRPSQPPSQTVPRPGATAAAPTSRAALSDEQRRAQEEAEKLRRQKEEILRRQQAAAATAAATSPSQSQSQSQAQAQAAAAKSKAEMEQRARAAATAAQAQSQAAALARQQQQHQQQQPVKSAVQVVSAQQIKSQKKEEKAVEEEVDEYAEEEFENYDDDDFENEEEMDAAPAKPSSTSASIAAAAAAATASVVKDAGKYKELIAAENQAAVVRAQTPTSPPPRRDSSSSLSSSSSSSTLLSSTSSQPRKIVPLPTRQQRASLLTSASHIQKDKRAARILQLVTLSEESFLDLFVAEPVGKYEMQRREIGKGKIRNIAAQYNEDWISVGEQTEAPDVFTLAVQVPEDSFTSKKVLTQSTTAATGTSTATSTTADGMGGSMNLSGSGSARLQKFVYEAGQVVEALIMENTASTPASTEMMSGNGSALTSSSSSFPSSSAPASLSSLFSSIQTLVLPPAFGVRHVIDVHFSPVRSSVVAIAYSHNLEPHPITEEKKQENISSFSSSRSPSSARSLDVKSLICLFDTLTNSSSPTKILYCSGSISCLSIDSSRGHFVYGGLTSGSIAVWDVREEARHHRWIEEGGWCCRHPSYITDAAFITREKDEEQSNHQAPVMKIVALHNQEDGIQTHDKQMESKENVKDNSSSASSSSSAFDIMSLNRSTGSFELVSIDEVGQMIVWSGQELPTSTSTSISSSSALLSSSSSLSDHGIGIGSRIQLQQHATLSPSSLSLPHSARSLSPSSSSLLNTSLNGFSSTFARTGSAIHFQANDLVFRSGDGSTSEYLIALGNGEIRRGTKYATGDGIKLSPCLYSPSSSLSASFGGLDGGGDGNGAGDGVVGVGKSAGVSDSVDVCVCLSFSPFFPNYFLAGYSSGNVFLFNVDCSESMNCWFDVSENGGGVSRIHWCSYRSSVFYVVTKTGRLLTFELNQSEQSPTVAVQIDVVPGAGADSGAAENRNRQSEDEMGGDGEVLISWNRPMQVSSSSDRFHLSGQNLVAWRDSDRTSVLVGQLHPQYSSSKDSHAELQQMKDFLEHLH